MGVVDEGGMGMDEGGMVPVGGGTEGGWVGGAGWVSAEVRMLRAMWT